MNAWRLWRASGLSRIPCRPHITRRWPISTRNYAKIRPDEYDYDESTIQPEFRRMASSDISCTIVDGTGRVTDISKSFPRARFLGENTLHPRDLRTLSHAKVNLVPSILVRDRAMLVTMLDLQVIIRKDQVLILDSDDRDTSRLSLFVYDLEQKLRPNQHGSGSGASSDSISLPYEMKALESVLMNTVSTLEVEFKSQMVVINDLMKGLEDHIDRDSLRDLLVRSKAVSQFCQKCLLVRNVISELLETDEDLTAMYLTERSLGTSRDVDDHAEIELLLESYYKQVDETYQQAETIKRDIKTTEEITNIVLDANRNALMLMQLKITIATLGFTIGMFFAALYGMNLENFIEETDYGFALVTGAIVAVSGLLTWFNFRQLAIVRRVTMMGTRRRSPGLNFRLGRKRHVVQDGREVSWKWLVDR